MDNCYIAFIVRRTNGGWELLVLPTSDYLGEERLDVPRNRLSRKHSPEQTIAANLKQMLGIKGMRSFIPLGSEMISKGMQRTAYVLEAPVGLPSSLDHEMHAEMIRVPVHAEWRDLAGPLPMEEGTRWLNPLREHLGILPVAPYVLAIWNTISAQEDPNCIYEALCARHIPDLLQPFDRDTVAQTYKSLAGYTDDPNEFEIDYKTVKCATLAATIRVACDMADFTVRRVAYIQVASRLGLSVYDPQTRRLYHPGEAPAPWSASRADRLVIEVEFSSKLLAEFARLVGPLQVWPLPPPVDENGVCNYWREDILPSRLSILPENQKILMELDSYVTGYLASNEGLILSLEADNSTLEEELPSSTVSRPSEDIAEWLAIIERLGWAYVPNGPDIVWGELWAAARFRWMLDAVKEWCQRTGRTWVETHRSAGEVLEITRGKVEGAAFQNCDSASQFSTDNPSTEEKC